MLGLGLGLLRQAVAGNRVPSAGIAAAAAAASGPSNLHSTSPDAAPCLRKAQAGARVVYAVEASDMAHHARHLAASNPGIGDRIRVLHGKVEEIEVPEKVRA